MSGRCSHCGATTAWDDDVGSAVCTSCGSLTDPSQSVLTSAQYGNQNDTSEPSLWDPSASTTLKSFRVGNNWDLAGQGKELRDRKNAVSSLNDPRVFITVLIPLFCLVCNSRIHKISRAIIQRNRSVTARHHSLQPDQVRHSFSLG
jgi:hypothetical protein